jgi:hypothetical protein
MSFRGGRAGLRIARFAFDGEEIMKVALQADNGKYVCADLEAGGLLAADSDTIGPWETFELVDLGRGLVALVACNGLFVCAEGGGGREVIANRIAAGAWETFDRVDIGGGFVALRVCNGGYLRPAGDGIVVDACGNSISPSTAFLIVERRNVHTAAENPRASDKICT